MSGRKRKQLNDRSEDYIGEDDIDMVEVCDLIYNNIFNIVYRKHSLVFKKTIQYYVMYTS